MSKRFLQGKFLYNFVYILAKCYVSDLATYTFFLFRVNEIDIYVMNLKLITKEINNNDNKTNQIKNDCDLQLYENEIIPSCFTCNQHIDLS